VESNKFPANKINQKQQNILLPLAGESIPAGFPSPADNYIEDKIDINEHLIHNPESTFFLRVRGISMIGAGIHDGDLVIVDRSLNANPGHIVVAIVDGEFTLKRLTYLKGEAYLEAENDIYPKIDLRQYQNVQIWGIAIYCIHKL
tara:strand:- start:1312 stop:1746 length:435 start_codon:yes stop_codon:yes gene_type:complete